jgi:hypothetical protein
LGSTIHKIATKAESMRVLLIHINNIKHKSQTKTHYILSKKKKRPAKKGILNHNLLQRNTLTYRMIAETKRREKRGEGERDVER